MDDFDYTDYYRKRYQAAEDGTWVCLGRLRTGTTRERDEKGAWREEFFQTHDAEGMAAWVIKYKEEWNLYHSANVFKSPSRNLDQVAQFLRLWVDIDPAHDSDKGRVDDVALSIVDFSQRLHTGGGWQVEWDLKKSIPATAKTLAKLDACLEYLIEKHGGDQGAKGANRMLRVPCTTNYPDWKKAVEKGRGWDPRPVRVPEVRETRFERADVVPDEALNKYLDARRPASTTNGTSKAPERYIGRADSGLLLPNDLWDVIENWENGTDAQGKRYESRSHALMGVLARLTAHTTDDELIKAIILNPDHDIGANRRERVALLEGEISKARDSQRRNGQQQQQQQNDEQEWGEYIDVRTAVKLPPFPKEVLPREVSDAFAEIAHRLNVDYGAPATLGLATLSVVCGTNCQIEVNAGWIDDAPLYGLLIGEPSTNKSAVLEKTASPIYKAINEVLGDEYLDEVEEYDQKLAEWKEEEKHWKAKFGEYLKAREEGEEAERPGPPPVKPERPRKRCISFGGGSPQGLADAVKHYPYGMAIHSGELSGVFASSAALANGKRDPLVEFLLMAATGDEYHYSTVDESRTRYLERPRVGMTACAQPSAVSVVLKDNQENGLAQRMALVSHVFEQDYPEGGLLPVDTFDTNVLQRYVNKALRIWRTFRPLPHEDPELRRVTFPLDEEALTEFCRWGNHIKRRAQREYSGALRSHVAKFDRWALRLALVLHVLRLPERTDEAGRSVIETDECIDRPDSFGPEPSPINVRTMRDAGRILEEYYLPQAVMMYGGLDPTVLLGRRIAGWILGQTPGGHRRSTFKIGEVRNAMKVQAEQLWEALRLLEDYGMVRRLPAPRGRGRGTTWWGVHPAFLAEGQVETSNGET